MYKMLFEMSV